MMCGSSSCGWLTSLQSVSRAGLALFPSKWLTAVRPVEAGWKRCPFLSRNVIPAFALIQPCIQSWSPLLRAGECHCCVCLPRLFPKTRQKFLYVEEEGMKAQSWSSPLTHYCAPPQHNCSTSAMTLPHATPCTVVNKLSLSQNGRCRDGRITDISIICPATDGCCTLIG